MSDDGRLALNEAAELLANNINRLLMSRALGQTAYSGDRDYYEVLGYPSDISIENYIQRYERQNIASRVVDLPASDSWKKPPIISEDNEEETEFAKAWVALNKRLGVYNVLSRADKLSGIGRFGVIFIGLRDEAETDKAVEMGKGSGEGDVLFLRPFSEYHVEIKDWEEDSKSPRYGMPLEYELSVQDDAEPITVHWTRIIHLADNKLDNEIYGVPRLRPVYNLLDDLIKITGGAAEATWLNMRPGIMVSPDEGYKWDDTTGAETKFLEEVQRYAHDPLRMLRLVGLKADPISSPQVMDPKGPYDVTISLMAAATGIPQRVLTGSSAGELASAKEDMRQWAQYIANRQTNYAEPEILRPFIDRLIQYGVLPVPKGGLDAYDIGTLDPDGARSWPSIMELSEAERAEAVSTQATAVKSLADPVDMTLPITLIEQRQLLGYPEEPEEGWPKEEEFEDIGVMAMAIRNYRAGQISAEQLAQFALENLVDSRDFFTLAKKKGPGKGWWGPPKGTHTGEERDWSKARNLGEGEQGDARRWGDSNLKPDYSDEEMHAVATYTGDGYRDLNGALRGHEVDPDVLESYAEDWAKETQGATDNDWNEWKYDYVDDYTSHMVDRLDSAIAKSSAPEDMIVYRGVHRDDIGAADFKPGDSFTDDGYTSASLHSHVAMNFGNHQLEIRVKEGTKLTYPDGYSNHPSEIEVVFGRGAEFTVIEAGSYVTVLEMTG